MATETETATTTITSIPPLVLTNVTQPAQQSQYHGDYAHAGFIDSSGPVNLTQIEAYNMGIGGGEELGLTAYSPSIIMADNAQNGHGAMFDLRTESLEANQVGADDQYIPVIGGSGLFWWGGTYPDNLFYGANPLANSYGPFITVYGGLVIAAGGDSMEALSLADGSTIWSTNALTSYIGYASGTVVTIPTVGGDLVVVGLSSPNVVMAFNASTGQYVWSIDLNASSIDGSPAYSNGYFYFASGDRLYKVSLNGNMAWDDDLGVPAMDTPAVAYGALYLGTNNGLLLAINATTGSVVWYDDLNGSVTASPIVSTNAVVYAATMNGMVYSINARNGQVLSSYNVEAPVTANPVLTGGYLLVLDDNGVLHVFKP
ncbi:hypothetical protein GCM10007981_10050 [Thermocladium modestius]|uniref:Pyrrolo-quinoline quinone repeat domain-containing protein n=2 Tax=Thermocladium modestius TaxID=62609 RepID=A0A830GWN7_9CREN|nr:hypothetical protein GCM10007981_10050 [Thermocladium modestius]